MSWLLLLYSCMLHAYDVRVYTEILEPHQYYNDDGELTGYSVEVVNKMFELTGDRLNLEVLPWARAYQKILREPDTMIFSIARTTSREDLFHWVGTLSTERVFFWGHKVEFPQPFKHLDEVKIFSIAATLEANPEQFLTRNQFPQVYRLSSQSQVLKMLFNHRVDLVVYNTLGIKLYAEQNGRDFSAIAPLFEVEELNSELSVAFNKQSNEQLVSRYQVALQELYRNGTIRKLRGKWGILD